VNRFVQPGDEQVSHSGSHIPSVEPFRVDPEIERRQVERLRAVRAGRSQDQWQLSVSRVETAAQDGTNLVPPILAAIEAHATLGEVADAMRRVFGEYQER
jgi:methylmalonyl-CoA mutase N-terminal domain/subunit